MTKVYLIGAGPGNEELVTVKALKVLKKCTAVLYDRLAGGNLLKYLNDNCEVYYCGKEPGCHYKSQEEINEMLVKLAKEGHIVGRIKGGDPYVFGRGGEEALALLKENIPFEVVPGITSAISVLSYAGIPVTSRGYSQSFHVFTGMSAKKLNINWESVAKLTGTLIFLMGLENIENISEYLLINGMEETTPAAVVMRGTTSKQQIVVGQLNNIAEKAREAGFKSPCIIVVGDVVNLSDSLNWYGKMPLFGINVCVTRAKEQAEEISSKLLELGAEVTQISAIKIKNTSSNLEEYVSKLSEYEYIVMTSINSVNIFFNYLKENKIDIRKIKGSFAVIGTATEKALLERGIAADIIAKEFVGESLSEILCLKVKEGEKVLIPCSKLARKNIGEDLIKKGCIVDEVHIYEPVKGELLDKASFDNVDVVLLTSPSGVRNLIEMVGLEALKSKANIAIGPITLKELDKNEVEAVLCDKFTTDGMLEKLIQLQKDKNINNG